MNKTFWNRFLDSSSHNRKSKIQNLKWAGLFAIVVALTVCGARAEAQQPKKVPRIGFLETTPSSVNSARHEAFRQGLHELGHVGGKSIVIEWLYADGTVDRPSALAAALVRLRVDIIVSGGRTATHAAKEASVQIPIVMGQA